MASNQLTLAFANDSEISAFGFDTVESAVSHYSAAASDGFVQCRFVVTGLQDLVTGVHETDFVLVVTGVNQLTARIGRFGDQPTNLRGWLLFSNSNYFLGELDFVFGSRGGTSVYVDNFLCGANGLPACSEQDWEFKDYFGELDEVIINGTTFVKAWHVDRTPGPYASQNLLSINSISWCGEIPHSLADGSIRKVAKPVKKSKNVLLDQQFQELYDKVGSPFIMNGKTLSEVLVKPIYCHALVKCHCGKTAWTVGDWSCYKSMCCGLSCKPLAIVNGEVIPGDVLVTSDKVSASGTKYYNGMVLKFVDKIDNVCLWRITQVQSCMDVVASGNYKGDEYIYHTDDVCSPTNVSKTAYAFKLCYFAGVYTDEVKSALLHGEFDVSTSICDVSEYSLHKPWFVREMDDLLGVAWDSFVQAVKSLSVLNSQLSDLMSGLVKATVKVVNGTIELCAQIPECFNSVFEHLKNFVETLFDLTVNTVTFAGQTFKAVGDYVLLDNAIVKFVSVKVKGLHQDGIKSTMYATTVVGKTAKVKSRRIETCNANLSVVPDQQLVKDGVTKIIGGRSFFCSGGCYRLMSDVDTVILSPVYQAAAPAEVVFNCVKPATFVDPVCNTLPGLVSDVTKQLLPLNKPYRFYDIKVKDGICTVTQENTFRAPSYMTDKDLFVQLCEECVDVEGFDDFYVKAHAATSLSQFEPTFPVFQQLLQEVECPQILKDIDGGSIWKTFIQTVSDAVGFVKSIKIDFGLNGIVITATKRFKKFAGILLNLYREFIASVTNVIKIGGKAFTYYLFEKPKVAIAGVLHNVRKLKAADCKIVTESVLVEMTVFDSFEIPIQPSRVEIQQVELEETEFFKPEDGGLLAVVDNYTFYNKGDYYYPANETHAVPVCYKRGSGTNGTVVKFSEAVQVKEIEPVHRVKLEYEFDDETITEVCKKVIGKRYKFTGTEWDELCNYIHSVMKTVSEHIEVPDYFIYDEEGGQDFTKVVMVSQYSIAEDQESEDRVELVQQSVSELEQPVVPVGPDQTEQKPLKQPVKPQKSQLDEVNEAFSFMLKSVEAKPKCNPFNCEFYDYKGIRVLKQKDNNCWVSSTLVQLQLLECYDDPAFDLFKAGSVAPMVKKCYELTKNIIGSAGDVSFAMEQLLKDLHTMFITFDVTCSCFGGEKRQSELSGCVFRFLPTSEPFAYGGCGTCGKPLMHTITSMCGTGVFCQNPQTLDVNTLLLQPMCASVFIGNWFADTLGHYKTNIYDKGFCIDGVGTWPVTLNTLNTICYKDVSYTKPVVAEKPMVKEATSVQEKNNLVKPFATHGNVEFYKGDVAELTKLEHDFVVNAANENLSHGGGVAAAINKLTNGLLQTLSDHYVKKNGKIKVGHGVMLHCGKENVLNVVGPRKGKHSPQLLEKAYKFVLKQKGTPLTPLLSVGIFKVPLQESVTALLNVVGDRHVKCFCYSDSEVGEIQKCLPPTQVVTEVSLTQQVKTECVVKDVIVTPQVEKELKPYRVEGKFSFYDAPITDVVTKQPDRVVFFTDSKLTLCDVAVCLDKHYDGALSGCIQSYLAETPNVPAGNLLTLKCENAVPVSLAVLPDTDSANYDKNLRRTLTKVSKLKGYIVSTVPPVEVMKQMLKCCTTDFVVTATTKAQVSECFETKVVEVKVTHDGRDVHTVKVKTDVVLDEQVGVCSMNNNDLTGVKPDDVLKDVISVAPEVDWITFYGFPRADLFHTLDHHQYAYESKDVDGKRVLKFSDNNCWVNTICLQLQFAKAIFKTEGLQAMWDEFLTGKVERFVHWLYWYQNIEKGQPGDVEYLLGKIGRYLVNSGTVTIVKTSECCTSKRTLTTPVVEASILKSGIDDGVCKHGNACVSRISAVRGTVIVIQSGKPKVYPRAALIEGDTYTTYAGSVEDGHYTVFETKNSKVYDGDTVSTGNDLSTRAVSSIVVTNKLFDDPVEVVERKASNVINTLDVSAEKFFSFGDIVSRNFVTMLVWLFSMLSLVFKAFKNKDVKVIAQAPHRTGLILSRSLKYNVRATNKFLQSRAKWVFLFGKLMLVLSTLYALWFLLLRFGPLHDTVCTGYVEGYAKSNFDKNAFCDGLSCKMCLYGYEELSEFPHTVTTWTHVGDPLFKTMLPLFYIAFLLIFGGVIVRGCMLYFVAQYVNQFGVTLGLQDSVWALQLVPFSIFGDEIVVLFLVVKFMLFLKHVFFGCEKPSCVACSKSARLTRIPMQTIVNGSNRSFYVSANGGKKFCEKHKFFCVNCDSYGQGNTFINDVVAAEVSNVVKTSVLATGPATIDITKVEFHNGFYYLYGDDGKTFWRYNFDITEGKYSCKEVLKNCNVLADFIVYNNVGSNLAQVKNACVYFSQLLCKPIKLVDSTLLSTLNVDFNGALHSAFVEVLNESFSKDLKNCTTMADCKTALDIDADDEEFVNGVSNAHRYNILLSDLSYNNFVTSYAKPEEKLSTHDLAACMRGGAKVVNHNILVKENTPIVWYAKDFNMLSEEGRRYVVKTAKLKGVSFLLTFNDNRMQTQIPVVSVTTKCGSGLRKCYNYIWWICAFILCVFLATGFVDYTSRVMSDSDYDFRYIEGGKLKVFDIPLKCVHNTFLNFDNWYKSKFGFIPSNDKRCPIVVGVSNEVRTIPGVPSGVFLFGKTLVFALQTVFGGSHTCYDLFGPASVDQCLFDSACTVLNGLGGERVYCYKNGLVEGASLYSELQPNSYYSLSNGGYIRLPEVITSGLGFRTVRTQHTTYCRMGECVESKAGVCFGANRFLVYSAESGQDFVCGTGLLSLLLNLFNMFSSSFSVVAMSGQIVFNCVLTCIIIMACLLVTKLKRMFGDLSFGVCTVVCVAIVNNLSYIITQNAVMMVVYAVLYFLSTRTFRYGWIWHVGYCIAYSTMAPWWLLFWYICAALIGLVPSLLKLKVTSQLFDGDKFVGSFETAATGTFVLDMHSYQRIVNSISPEKIKQHAASYNKYKYYSGAASEADYRLACYAHLAKAVIEFGTNHQDMLYTPPTISYNSTLQSGLRKMAQPSGVVEKCVVRVCYGNMALNGLWLGDVVICPRHVIASNTSAPIDYEHEISVMRLHNFSVSVGNVFLGVISATMKGANLYIKVNQTNVNTPEHSFKTIKQGDSFNILACYDGMPSGVYGVTMRNNYTIRGSFITGACGSPGYNVTNGKVEFCYLHQLELGSGCHVGSTLEGVMYGCYEDQPTLQIEGINHLVTPNVIAFLYGALLNGITWWLNSDKVSIESFNEWALNNGFTTCGNLDCFTMLAAKTGVDVQRLLAAVQRLHTSFGGKNILGFTTLTDEFTVGEVIKQMYGVTLQSTKVVGAFCNLVIVGLFATMFWSELLQYTAFFWVSPGFVTPVFFALLLLSCLLMCMLKHKILFLYTFLIPSVLVMASHNFVWDWYVAAELARIFDYHVSMLSFDIQGLLNVAVCLFVTLLHTMRFFKTNTSISTYVLSLAFTVYGFIMGADVLSIVMTLLFNLTSSWYVGAIVYKLAFYLQYYTSFAQVLGSIKAIMLCYVGLGYLCCVYYGFLYWINRFLKLSLGVYDFKVSANEFKFMVANGLQAPRGVFDSLALSIKLMGIGGEKTIKVSSVQSKLTDIKCTNVVLLGCLSSMNIAANTKEWSYCVDLHNKINLCNDPEAAQEMLLALLAFFLSKHKDFGFDDLLDSYFADNSILQSVASTFVNMPSFIAYENARQSYEDAVANGSAPQLIKQLKTAMNIAKSEFDREVSVQKKISRMAEQAAAQMYKEARAVNRKSKVIGAMHSLLMGMLRKLDMSNVDTILSLAKDGVVPLSIIPAACSTKLNVVSADLDSYYKICRDGCVHYAGVIWNVIDIRDNDGKIVHAKEITQENVEAISWPIFLNCERIVKLQNNEIMPGKLKQRPVKAEGEGISADGMALFNNESGKTFMYAFIADKPDLKFVKWEFDNGCSVIELEPPCRFAVQTPTGTTIKYLYFVRNLNTLRRGAVLGFIGATVRLQAGKQTELAVNSPLLTMCAFSVDPAKTYIDAVKRGAKPVGNCIKMLANGSGTGQAVTNGVEANTNQDSYGGASVCLYCRAHVEHPGMDGHCKLKGRYVQVPIGTIDPIRFVLENEACRVCQCWLNNGCACDRVSTAMQAFDNGYLNEHGALVPLN
nr:ORF1a polyprotein [Alphacoronavirus sp.]